MSAAQSLVLIAREGGVVTWTLNRPAARNAFDRPLLQALGDAAAAVAADRSVRAVIVTGAGDKAFSAGADLKERQGMTIDESRAFVASISATFDAVAHVPCPTIAAVNGVAFGGGMELLLACDLRVIAAEAQIGLTETAVGIMPGAGGTQRLPRLIGAARAKEMVFMARRLDAATALAWGLANRVVPAADVMSAAQELAAAIAGNAPLAVRQAKVALDAAADVAVAAGLAIEQKAYEPLLHTRDRIEGLQAFAAKRSPQFRGE
jgi:enoyl-CoA hydratase/carnithine racemase